MELFPSRKFYVPKLALKWNVSKQQTLESACFKQNQAKPSKMEIWNIFVVKMAYALIYE